MTAHIYTTFYILVLNTSHADLFTPEMTGEAQVSKLSRQVCGVGYRSFEERRELHIRVWVCARSGFQGRREKTVRVNAQVLAFLETLEASGTNTSIV